MAGAPSQVDLFDDKPKLQQYDGQSIPDEFVKGERFAFIKGTPKLLGSPYRLPEVRAVRGRDLDLLPQPTRARGRHRDRALDPHHAVQPRARADLHEHRAPDRRPAQHGVVGHLRPRAARSRTCPASSCCSRGERTRTAAKSCWGSGFLPTVYQGVEFRSKGDPVLFLTNPPGVRSEDRRELARRAARADHDRSTGARAIPRSTRASPPTSWPTACRRACPS